MSQVWPLSQCILGMPIKITSSFQDVCAHDVNNNINMPKFLSEEEFERQKRIHKIVQEKHAKRTEEYLEAVRTHPCRRVGYLID